MQKKIEALIYIALVIILPERTRLILSFAKVEKVVNPPQNPTVRKRFKALP